MSTQALQETLAAEHAAVWVFALLGGQASENDRLSSQMSEAHQVHRDRRDDLIVTLTRIGETPVASEIGYRVPETPDAARILAVARTTEERCAARYADLVARTEGAQRHWAIEALTDAAVRQLRFRGSPEIFPGAPDLTDR